MKLFLVLVIVVYNTLALSIKKSSPLNFQKGAKCGFVNEPKIMHRVKRFSLMDTKWGHMNLTWKFNSERGGPNFDESTVRSVIYSALKVWSEPSNLKFREVSDASAADIVISFESQYHFDVDKYRMEGSTLAHAFGPGTGIGGDVHLRRDIVWDFNVRSNDQPADDSNSLFATLVHELGHTIGLQHSDDLTATMYSSYSEYTGVLSDDDVRGIQSLYGKPRDRNYLMPTRRTLPKTRKPSNEPIPNHCDMSYDAISTFNGELFIFKGIHVWRPKYQERMLIRQMWDKLPENLTHIDAFFQTDDRQLMIFIARTIYLFRQTRIVGQLTLTQIGIPRHFSKIDAIFRSPIDQQTYIVCGDYVWLLRDNRADQKHLVEKSNILKVKHIFDTIYSNKTNMFFFRGKKFYEFDLKARDFSIRKPKLSAPVFMKCSVYDKQSDFVDFLEMDDERSNSIMLPQTNIVIVFIASIFSIMIFSM